MRFSESRQWTPRLVRIVEVARSGNEVEALRIVVDGLRPGPDEDPAARVEALVEALSGPDETAAEARETLGRLVHDLPDDRRVFAALSRSGIPGDGSFVGGAAARLGRRILPPVPDPEDVRDLLRAIFQHPRDHVWVSEIPEVSLRKLLTVLGVTAESFPGIGDELALAIRVLARHVASLGAGADITDRLPHLLDPASPFLLLGPRVERYLECHSIVDATAEGPSLDEIFDLVARCRAAVDRLRAEKPLHGTSLHLTGLSFRMLALLDRLDLLLHLTEPVERDF